MVRIDVYGSDRICPSCVHLPSSKETVSWLEAALTRKYGTQILVHYVDILSPQGEQEKRFSQRVLDEELWYPVVVIDCEIIDEGNPSLKKITHKLESLGVQPVG